MLVAIIDGVVDEAAAASVGWTCLYRRSGAIAAGLCVALAFNSRKFNNNLNMLARLQKITPTLHRTRSCENKNGCVRPEK